MRIGLLFAWAVAVATEGDGETVGPTSPPHAIKTVASPNHRADRPTTRTSRGQADRLSDCNSPGSIQHIVCCLHNKVSNRLCGETSRNNPRADGLRDRTGCRARQGSYGPAERSSLPHR